jgi:hypothetical protein
MGRGGACGVYLVSQEALEENVRKHPPAPGHGAALLGSGEVAVETRTGEPTRCRLAHPVPRFAQFPVLYYPGVLDVRDNGARVPYSNLGPFVAEDLSEGNHVVTIRFVGLPGCNALGLACWAVVTCGALGLAWARLRRGRASAAARPPAAHAPAAASSPAAGA